LKNRNQYENRRGIFLEKSSWWDLVGNVGLRGFFEKMRWEATNSARPDGKETVAGGFSSAAAAISKIDQM
jgi:hypothetical protein